jgi:hypothetical protein
MMIGQAANPDYQSAAEWDAESSKRALDELFKVTSTFRSKDGYLNLINFVRRFRFYSPYNAFLIHIQRPGSTYVAPSYRWERKYGRLIKPNALPIVILQPMGPVMFVFDVSDTEPGPNAGELPPEIANPFDVEGEYIDYEFERTMDNAVRDGIRIHPQKAGAQRAGSITKVDERKLPPMIYKYGKDKNGRPKSYSIPVRYDMLINQEMSREAQYTTIVHELAHLYCGHFGTPKKTWWPNRTFPTLNEREFEAESVSYLVCSRRGINTKSEQYLYGYLEYHSSVPNISFECVMKAAGLIESMGQKRLKPRKQPS